MLIQTDEGLSTGANADIQTKNQCFVDGFREGLRKLGNRRFRANEVLRLHKCDDSTEILIFREMILDVKNVLW